MDIKLLGPELENVQSDARRELSETIERRQKEVEAEVLENLSELASDGKRVLKSQKPTYEMMLQLDGLVSSNVDLFLSVNELCEKTGVSLNAIINRMIEKNYAREGQEPVQDNMVQIETPVVETTVEIPQAMDVDKKKVGSPRELASEEIEGLLGQSFEVPNNDNSATFDIPRITLEDDYDPEAIKYDWQKSTFALGNDEIVQDLPVSSFAEQTFETPEMSDSEVQAAQENLAATSEFGANNFDNEFVVASKDNVEVPEVPRENSYRRVRGRRLHSWLSANERYSAILRASVYGEDFNGKSEDYRNISVQIGNLQLNYRDFSPEDDNLTLDTLDQSIGASKTLNVTEKRRLYRKLNSSAKRIERYARSNSMVR